MFRNNYDNDSVTFSPQGRIFQVEYALEAIKQGSAAVGLVSKKHAVLVALKRNAEELGSYQKKIIGIDSHFGIALAGLAPDARVLSNFMRTQSRASRMLYQRNIPLSRITTDIADKAQMNTQHYGRRPYGVGLLIAGVDDTGPHLYEFMPSGMVQEYVGCAIGARSQSARTYLERNFDEFADSTKEQLVEHGLKALRDSLPQDKELNIDNTSVAIVGIDKADRNFKLFDGEEVDQWLKLLGENRSSHLTRARQEQDTEAEGEVEAMETD